MGYVHEVVVAKDIRQAVWAGVHLHVRGPSPQPRGTAATPQTSPQEDHEYGYYNGYCHVFSHMVVRLRPFEDLASKRKVALWSGMAKAGCLIKISLELFHFGGYPGLRNGTRRPTF
jgi:hypothetical protein